jgi:hypothetical protein
VKLHTEGDFPFVKYSNGEMFGDSDSLLDLPRDGKAVAMTHLTLKSLNVRQFELFFINSQDTCLSMIVDARRKRDKHLGLINKVDERKRKKLLMQNGNLLLKAAGGSQNLSPRGR